MGHDHTHEEGHDHGHRGHDHSHIEHFKSCRDPNTCLCEVKRLSLAFLCITTAIGFQLWFLAVFTSSYGAEGDVSHSAADNLYYLALIPLVLFKRSHKGSATKIDLVGFCLNTALLLVAAAFIVYRLAFGHQTRELEPWAMAAVGAIGLAGNISQFVALGEINWEGTSNRNFPIREASRTKARSTARFFFWKTKGLQAGLCSAPSVLPGVDDVTGDDSVFDHDVTFPHGQVVLVLVEFLDDRELGIARKESREGYPEQMERPLHPVEHRP